MYHSRFAVELVAYLSWSLRADVWAIVYIHCSGLALGPLRSLTRRAAGIVPPPLTPLLITLFPLPPPPLLPPLTSPLPPPPLVIVLAVV